MCEFKPFGSFVGNVFGTVKFVLILFPAVASFQWPTNTDLKGFRRDLTLTFYGSTNSNSENGMEYLV